LSHRIDEIPKKQQRIVGLVASESEVADKVEDTANNVALVEELEARYKEVLNALEKFEKGTYGVCEHSGEAIPAERLEANPAARTCIAHA
jgi:RNA polymerase-binding transcription factor DksA